MAVPYQPTLIYPNGGEDILTREIEIRWKQPNPIARDGLAVFYEICYSENFDFSDQPDWHSIAFIPSGVDRYRWRVGNSIKGNNVRVAVRAVNTRGEKTPFSVSAAPFTIRRSGLSIPAVLSPLPNSRHGNRIDIVFDTSAIIGTYSERSKVYAYYSSKKLNIPLTPVAIKIPVSTPTIMWNTSALAPSDDYQLTVYLADDDGNRSPEVNIRGLEILNEGFFIIDTIPPVGVVTINDGDEFTRERDVLVKLFAVDGTTGIHSLQFVEEQDGSDINGPAEEYTTSKFFRLSEGDGEKTLKVQFQDFAGNRSSDLGRNFRPLFALNNNDISDIIIDPNDENKVWFALNDDQGNIYLSEDAKTSFITSIAETVVELAIYSGDLYISANTEDNTAKVYKRNADSSVEVAFSLTDFASEIISMVQYGNNLYLGSLGGSLYQYDGTAVSLLREFSEGINELRSDGSLLYILLNNSRNLTIFDGTSYVEVES